MEKLRLTTKEQSDVLLKISEKLRFCNNYAKFNYKPNLTLNEKEKEKVQFPTLFITAGAYLKMFMLVDGTENEISWHGLVNRNKKQNTYELYDIIMFPQYNTSVHTGTDDNEYMSWLQNKIKDENFDMSKLRCHGHSHVRMGTSASPTDDTYQSNMVSDIKDGDFYLFMIVNKRRDINIYLYDFNQQILFTEREIALEIVSDGTCLLDWTRKAIKDNVKEEKYNYSYHRKKERKNGHKSK